MIKGIILIFAESPTITFEPKKRIIYNETLGILAKAIVTFKKSRPTFIALTTFPAPYIYYSLTISN